MSKPDITSFATLSLKKPLLDNLDTLGYAQMTPIQQMSLPIILGGHDLIAQAETGSGKTAAFGLALLNQLNIEHYAVQGLVLCPTRELAEQVCQALRQLARLMPNIKVLNLSGGIPMKPQLDSLRHSAHLIVGTPGRIKKHLDKASLDIRHLKTLVLDEADRMLDMGFIDAMKEIIALCPPKRQTLLFSATYPTEIKELANEFLTNPKKIAIKPAHTELSIDQVFYEAGKQSDKYAILKSLLQHHQPASALIFCNTKEQTTQLARQLVQDGFSAIALNGDMEQIDRDIAMIRFGNKSCTLMVATDVAARGLDIKELPAIINYDLAFERATHIHRIGRTGRAGSKGVALSITTPADAERLCLIENESSTPIVWGDTATLQTKNAKTPQPEMVTLCINAGRKDKIRPGDILGGLTKDAGLPGDAVGKIDITALYSYVAVKRESAGKAYDYFLNGKIKGKKAGVKKL